MNGTVELGATAEAVEEPEARGAGAGAAYTSDDSTIHRSAYVESFPIMKSAGCEELLEIQGAPFIRRRDGAFCQAAHNCHSH